MKTIYEQIHDLGIIPVVVLDDAKDALPLGQALIDGGLPVAEVTFRTAAAEESIRLMSGAFPDMLVGAGTVLTVDQAERAVRAGAKFIVSPGFDGELADWCLKREIPVFPGCVTPSELMQAVKRGLSVVKFFPAESFGGLKTIKSLAAPFPGLKFMPTGGISAANAASYLSDSRIIAAGGSWMVKSDLIRGGQFDRIRELCLEAAAIVREVRA